MNKNARTLIVDDDKRMANTLVDIINTKGYKAEVAYSGHEALAMVKKGLFDCVLTDIKMPVMNGVELCKAIKKKNSDLPVVMMTAYSTDRLVKEGMEQGAIATLTKPLDINVLLSFFSTLRKECSIVIVDDDPQFSKSLGDILRKRSFRVTEINDSSDLGDMLRPDVQVVLLDIKLNGVTGLDVLKEIRKQHPHLPVIMVTGYQKEMAPAIEACLKIGAYTCLYKPFEIEELLKILTEIRHQKLGKILEQAC